MSLLLLISSLLVLTLPTFSQPVFAVSTACDGKATASTIGVDSGPCARPPASSGHTSKSSSSSKSNPHDQTKHASRDPPPLPSHAEGCFVFTHATGAWDRTQCSVAPLRPMAPSLTQPSTVGNGFDLAAQSASTKIGSATGSFQSITGLTSESGDSACSTANGPNCYSLQLNTQFFGAVSTTYTDNKAGYSNSWEQFIYTNSGAAFIQFWLLGYKSAYGGCPSTGPPGGSSWMPSGGHCYANSAAVGTPTTPATDLAKLSLTGSANLNGSGNDQVTLCISGGTCYSITLTDGVVNLSQNWLDSEFNVFGDCCLSQANFNLGTSITILNALEDQSGNPITPTCVTNGFTGETNNLNLLGCNSSSSGISFTESTFNFSVSASPSTETVLRGETASYTLTLTLLSGPPDSVTLSVLFGVPSGATRSFTFNPVTPTVSGATSVLNVDTSISGGRGDFTVFVEGADGLLTQDITLSLHVYDFTVAVSPSDHTVLRGGSTSYTATLMLIAGSSTTGVPAMSLATPGLPSDATIGLGLNSITPTLIGVSTTINVATAPPPAGSLGDFPFTVTGTNLNGHSRSGSASLHIYDFTITTTPSSLQVLTTGSNAYSIAVALTPGSSTTGLPSITLTVTGLPSGAKGLLSTTTSTPGFSSMLTISTTTTPSGTYKLTITGTDSRTPEGGTRTNSPTLVVLTPQQALQLSINHVDAFQSAGVLSRGQANSLEVKLQNAINSLNLRPPDKATACNQLTSFVNEVNSLVAEGVLSPAQANMLLGGPLGINAIMAAIPC